MSDQQAARKIHMYHTVYYTRSKVLKKHQQPNFLRRDAPPSFCRDAPHIPAAHLELSLQLLLLPPVASTNRAPRNVKLFAKKDMQDGF